MANPLAHPQAPKPGTSSPWGLIQHVEAFAEAGVFVSTASHGGAWLCPEAQARMPAGVQPMHGRQWWEEDCEILAPVLVFGADGRLRRSDVILELHRWYPGWLEALAPICGAPNAAQVARILDLHAQLRPDGKPDLTTWRRARQSGAVSGEIGAAFFTIAADGEAVG